MYIHFRFLVSTARKDYQQHADIRVDRLAVSPQNVSGDRSILAERAEMENNPGVFRWRIVDPDSDLFDNEYAYFIVDDRPAML